MVFNAITFQQYFSYIVIIYAQDRKNGKPNNLKWEQ